MRFKASCGLLLVLLVACEDRFDEKCPDGYEELGKDCVKTVVANAGQAGAGGGGWGGAPGGQAGAAGASGGAPGGKAGAAGGGQSGSAGAAGGGQSGSGGTAGVSGAGGGGATGGNAGAAGASGAAGNAGKGGVGPGGAGGTPSGGGGGGGSAGSAGTSGSAQAGQGGGQPACKLGELTCVGAQPMECTAAGLEPKGSACASAALCSQGNCAPPACAQGQKVCQGKDVLACNSDLTGTTKTDTCGKSEVCVGGQCARPSSVVAGKGSTCAAMDSGHGYCWGAGKQPAPTLVTISGGAALEDVKTFSLAQDATCALTNAGAVFCWGADGLGGLGDGDGDSSSPLPVQAALPVPAVDLRAAQLSTCAVGNDGLVYCWGRFLFENDPKFSPTAVAGVSGASRVAVGDMTRCALIQQDGSVVCWGAGGHGELGNAGTSDAASPQVVYTNTVATTPLLGMHDLSGGGTALLGHFCAVGGNGTANADVYCWGSNKYLESGAPVGNTTQPWASLVSAASSGITASAFHTCAPFVTVPGKNNVRCWGSNAAGAVGPGPDPATTPTIVPGVTDAILVSAGATHTCAITEGAHRTIRCWGANDAGQLGDGTFDPHTDAVEVELP